MSALSKKNELDLDPTYSEILANELSLADTSTIHLLHQSNQMKCLQECYMKSKNLVKIPQNNLLHFF